MGFEIPAKERRRIMKTWTFIAFACIALVTGACSSEFMLNKNGRAYFLGSNSKAKYDMLCTSGDLEKVLAVTQLSKEMKDAFYHYNCSVERSSEKIKQIYASMTPEERKDIKHAFKENGYGINQGLGCCAVQ
jgi:hypothetical protein